MMRGSHATVKLEHTLHKCSRAALLCVLICSSTLFASHQQGGEQFREHLCPHLSAQADGEKCFKASWRSREFMPVSADKDPRASLRRVLDYSVEVGDDTIDLSTAFDPSADTKLPSDRMAERSWWDGSRWMSLRPEQEQVSISERHPFNAPLDCVSLLLLNDWQFICGEGGILRSVSQGKILDFEEVRDGARIRFDLGGGRTTLEVVLTGTPALQLHSLALESWKDDGVNPRTRLGRIDVECTDWAPFSGRLLPRKVTRCALSDGLATAQGRPPTVTFAELELKDFVPSKTPHAQTAPTVPLGWWVNDNCQRLRYREGALEVEVDGKTHPLSAPISINNATSTWIAEHLSEQSSPTPTTPPVSDTVPEPEKLTPQDSRVEPTQPSLLSGTSSYDFGLVELKGNPTVVRHTFHLTNDHQDQAALKIAKVNSSCGCTVGKPSKESITAGDAVDVETSLQLFVPGKKTESVWLVLRRDDEEVLHKLTVSARGVAVREWFAVMNRTNGLRAESDTAAIIVLRPTGESPGDLPTVVCSNAEVDCVVDAWTKVTRGDAASSIPARWVSRATFRRAGSAQKKMLGDATLRIEQLPSLVLKLAPNPW